MLTEKNTIRWKILTPPCYQPKEEEMENNNSLIQALTKAQLEIKAPEKDKYNIHFKSNYCSLDSIYIACRIPLAKQGLTLSHSVENVNGSNVLVTTLYHVSGEKITNVMPLYIDKQTSQGLGSALTYARRYAICSLLGLPTEDDDDGNIAVKAQEAVPETIRYLTEAQCASIETMIGDDEEFKTRILKINNAKSFSEVNAKEFTNIMNALLARSKKGNL